MNPQVGQSLDDLSFSLGLTLYLHIRSYVFLATQFTLMHKKGQNAHRNGHS
ncbi:mCG147699 [Mus musculus]|nr:mCG147699 [Mus musculus]